VSFVMCVENITNGVVTAGRLTERALAGDWCMD
jgi:hypothetical protein